MPDASTHSTAAPGDPRLPHLGAALDADGMRARLRRMLGERGTLAVQVVKHVPGKRCVLAYRFEDGTRLAGKMYRKDRAARRAAALFEVDAALRATTRVPRPLGCIEELGLVLQEWAPGSPAPDWPEWQQNGAVAARFGTALADLHAAVVPSAKRADLAAHVLRTCHPGVEALAADQPAFAARVRDLLGAILERDRTASHPGVTTHGDYGPRQAFFEGESTYLVDLDGMCVSDRAFDVAAVRVGLEVHLGDAGRARREQFLAAYLERAGIESLPGLDHHEAFCDLRRALIVWRKRPAGWADELDRSLTRGAARL